MLLTGTKFTSPQGRLENTMDNETELELELVISRLTGITNEAKIYGEKSVLARLESFNNSDQIFVLLNRSLTAIHTLRKVIRETITLQKDAD